MAQKALALGSQSCLLLLPVAPDKDLTLVSVSSVYTMGLMSIHSHSTALRVSQWPRAVGECWAAWSLITPVLRAAGDNGAEGGPGEGAQQVPAVSRVLHRGQDVSGAPAWAARPGAWAGGAAAHTESLSVSGRAIDDKYSRREEYRGFTQDFKEKDGYKPDVKIEYVDETGRKLTPKEVSGASEAGLRGRAAPQGLGWGAGGVCVSGRHGGPPRKPGGRVPLLA